MPRMRQVRSVILERREDDKRRDVGYLTRMVRHITVSQASLQGAKGKQVKGLEQLDLWDGEPETPQRKRQLPSTSKVLGALGAGSVRGAISWEQVQARAAEKREAS